MSKTVYIAAYPNKQAIAALRANPQLEVILAETPAQPQYSIPKDIAPKVQVLFCELPPQNLDAMTALEYVQITSTGYTQLFGKTLPSAACAPAMGAASSTPPLPSGPWP